MSILSAVADRQRAAAFGTVACVMQDLLQHIDHDYYRAAQLLIARAEIAELRRRSSTLARTSHATPIVQSGSPEMKFLRDLSH
jgi:hypothetical protein